MAIMSKMRANTHIILFILLVLFVLSMTIGGLVGGADITSILSGHRPDTVVSVDGEDINYEQYNNIRQQQFDAYREQNQKEASGYELQQLEEQIYESVVRDILIKHFVEKEGITVSTKELAFHIIDNPPDFLRSNPNFVDSTGKFDINKYQSALSDPRNSQYWTYVQNYLAGMLPYEKVRQEVISSVFVTDEEAKQDFIKRNVRAKVKYIFFNPMQHKVEETEISNRQIEAYYKEHKEEYKEDAKRKVLYALFELKPSASDTSTVKEFAYSLLDSLKQGVDFAKLAETHSEDPGSAANGGDLNYFEQGMMVKPFEDAAFKANIGEIVGPVLTQHGFHIIKVEGKKIENEKEQVRARHILLRIEASRNTTEAVRDEANYFSERAQEDGFSQAIISESIKTDTTNFFSNSGFIPGLGMQKRMSDAIFNTKIGKVSRLGYIENRGYIIYEVIEIQKERTKPLDEVKASIKSILVRDKQKELAGDICRKFREKIQSPDDFERLAGQDSLVIEETDFFAMNGFVRSVGRDVSFIGTTFGLEANMVSGPINGTKGYYLIKLVEKQPFDESLFNIQKNNLKIDLLETKKRTAYNEWYDNLKENAKISDYRYKFYN